MPIGAMLHVLALVMLPFSSLEPLLKRLRLNRLCAALVLAAGLISALLSPIALTQDLSVSFGFIYYIALSAALLVAERKHRAYALLAAAFGGVLAMGAKILLPQPEPEPGLFAGLLAALGALAAGRSLKPRLSGALLGPILAHLAFIAADFAGFGYISPTLGGGAFFDEAAISLFFTCIAAVIFEARLEARKNKNNAAR